MAKRFWRTAGEVSQASIRWAFSLACAMIAVITCAATQAAEWYVVAGRGYQAYSSSDLQTWAPMGEPRRASDRDVLLSVTDPGHSATHAGFYRIEVRP
jgi:hypothetical protein